MKKREKERLDLMRRHPMDEYEHRCKCCGRPRNRI